MAPWSHLHVTPKGDVFPCCLINDDTAYLGNVNKKSLKTIWNSKLLKQLRLDMLNGVKNKSCAWCYEKEVTGEKSFRFDFNEKYSSNLTDVNNTLKDGTVENFNMRYIDIRFSNICNLKCRMCGPTFSSQWGKELNRVPAVYKLSSNMLEEIISYLETCEEIYFAGGEPLVMDEHYILLEKLLELGVKPRIRYNSNTTQLKHKNWDILELWSKFDDIYVQASIDGYGKELNYIRHPANYDNVIYTGQQYASVPSVKVHISTCIGFWNVWSLPELQEDLVDKKVILNYESFFGQCLIHPRWFSTKILPQNIKDKICIKLNDHADQLLSSNKIMPHSKFWWDMIISTMNASDDSHYWESTGRQKVKEIDKKRNEDFKSTFPHLADMLN